MNDEQHPDRGTPADATESRPPQADLEETAPILPIGSADEPEPAPADPGPDSQAGSRWAPPAAAEPPAPASSPQTSSSQSSLAPGDVASNPAAPQASPISSPTSGPTSSPTSSPTSGEAPAAARPVTVGPGPVFPPPPPPAPTATQEPSGPGNAGSPPPTTALPVDHLVVRRPTHRRGGGAGRLLGIALLALVLGLAGGLAGSAAYDHWIEDDGATTLSGGLEDVDLEPLPPLQDGGSVAAVADAVLPSAVQILAEYDGDDAGATGSGFVLDKQGHVITNNHVVAEAARNDGPIQVVDADGRRYDASVVGRSPVYDLAVLEVEDGAGLKPASLGRSEALRVGDPVVAIGSPLGLSATVTSGIVSALDRPVTTGDTEDDLSYINAVQTDAAINPGNSGGPLVDLRGRVVGVNSAIATNGGASGDAGNIGVGFAIPVEQVRITADQILATGEAQYPVIGAKVQTGGVSAGNGAVLDEIIAGSPAQAAGLEEGDRITSVDGQLVTDGIGLIVAIRTHQPGETIEFTLVREGDERTIEVTLDGEVG